MEIRVCRWERRGACGNSEREIVFVEGITSSRGQMVIQSNDSQISDIPKS